MQIGSAKQETNQVSTIRRRIYDMNQNRFDGYIFFCHKYGNKAFFCNGLLRNKIAWNNYNIYRFTYV